MTMLVDLEICNDLTFEIDCSFLVIDQIPWKFNESVTKLLFKDAIGYHQPNSKLQPFVIHLDVLNVERTLLNSLFKNLLYF